MGRISLPSVLALGREFPPQSTTLSGNTKALILAMLAEAGRLSLWSGANGALSDDEKDILDAMISRADDEIASGW